MATLSATSSAVTVKLNATAPVADAGATTEKCVAAPGVLVSKKVTVVRPVTAAVTV